jgi:hypothetical protein
VIDAENNADVGIRNFLRFFLVLTYARTKEKRGRDRTERNKRWSNEKKKLSGTENNIMYRSEKEHE